VVVPVAGAVVAGAAGAAGDAGVDGAAGRPKSTVGGTEICASFCTLKVAFGS
jgi:hypothetical protein